MKNFKVETERKSNRGRAREFLQNLEDGETSKRARLTMFIIIAIIVLGVIAIILGTVVEYD